MPHEVVLDQVGEDHRSTGCDVFAGSGRHDVSGSPTRRRDGEGAQSAQSRQRWRYTLGEPATPTCLSEAVRIWPTIGQRF